MKVYEVMTERNLEATRYVQLEGFCPKIRLSGAIRYTYLSSGDPVQGFFVVDTVSAWKFSCNKCAHVSLQQIEGYLENITHP